MSKFKFFPEDYELDEKLTEWTKKKGVSDTQIIEQLERIKIHEFQPMRSCPRRTWQRWIMNGIDWGRIVPTVQRDYRRPQELSEEQRRADILKFENDPIVRAARRRK